jgi:hypothetical protein
MKSLVVEEARKALLESSALHPSLRSIKRNFDVKKKKDCFHCAATNNKPVSELVSKTASPLCIMSHFVFFSSSSSALSTSYKIKSNIACRRSAPNGC